MCDQNWFNKIGNCITGLQVYNYSNYNDIRGNRVTNCSNGIELNRYVTYTILSNNTIENSEVGININTWSVNNTISRNCLAANVAGIRFYYANLNEVFLNNITDSDLGATLQYSQSNMFYSNNFINNTQQASVSIGYANAWDSGYPDGGNYWSDYGGLDQFSGPYQNVTGSDGIGDIPYAVDANNTDRFPLMLPYNPSPIEGDLNVDGTVDIFDIVIVALEFGHPPPPIVDERADANKDGIVDIFDIAIVAVHFGETNAG